MMRLTPSRRPRRGSALVAALAALALVTIAATAAATLARTLRHDARSTVAGLRARHAAEGALAATLAAWPPAWTGALPVGSTDARTTTSPAGTATVRALRLDGRRYFLTADASSPALAGPLGPAVRRAGLFAQLDGVAYAAPAALVAAGPVSLGLDAEVRAADDAPPGWSDCPPAVTETPTPAAVAAPNVTVSGTTRVLGATTTAPAAWTPPAVERFGDLDRAALVSRADVVVAAGTFLTPLPRANASGDPPCVRDRNSWGEPWRGATAVAACTGDYPVIHIRGPGTTYLRGPARLQGTLIVDGSLTVNGRVDVAGLVLVGGTLTANAGTLVVDGALLVRGTGATSLGANSRVRRSRCALERAAAGAARPLPVARHAWVDLVR